jgi:hypothetical protein
MYRNDKGKDGMMGIVVQCDSWNRILDVILLLLVREMNCKLHGTSSFCVRDSGRKLHRFVHIGVCYLRQLWTAVCEGVQGGMARASGNRPAHTSGNRPAHTSGNRSAHNSGNRPGHTSGNRPAHTSGNRPGHTSGNRSAHTSVNRPVQNINPVLAEQFCERHSQSFVSLLSC